MNLKDFLNRNGSDKKYYWALVLENGWIQAGIWEASEAKAEIVSISPATPWETDEDLLGACDTALSASVQNLPEDLKEPTKTVFGVPASWVEEGQIKKEYLDKIRKVCAELSLEPAGFVVLPEAIAHYFKSSEGSPLNAIVLGLSKENLDVAVFKLGNLMGTSMVARSVSVGDDVVEGLSRFNLGEALPSRIILYDGKEGELEDVRQALLKVVWEDLEKVKFLHTPKIEILEADKKVLATSLAGASELANVQAIESPKNVETPTEPAPEDANIEKPQDAVGAEDLGFVIGEDIEKTKEEAPRSAPAVTPLESPEKPQFFQNFLSKVQEKFSGSGSNKRAFITFGIVLVALIISGFVAWWYLPKATVTVYVSPQRLVENLTLVADTQSKTSDFASSRLAAELIKTEASGDKTKSTTGTKIVGDKAKGTVKIQNGTALVVNLPAGTSISGANDLKFSTKTTASISAALSPSSPGTTTVEVTAVDIGAAYNLVKDETFRVGTYPKAEVDAIATDNFSGGSSREIRAVSEEDQKALEEGLTQELVDRAKSDLASQVSEDKLFIENSVISEVASKDFSNKVGDEAENLKLSLALEVSGVVVKMQALYDLAKEVLREKVPSGYVLREDQLELTFETKGSKEGVYELETSVVVNLLPEVKIDEIARQIKGKDPKVAENYLTSIPGFTRAQIRLKPALPGFLGTLPRVVKNITIEVAAEK